MNSFIDYYRQGQADRLARDERKKANQFAELAARFSSSEDKPQALAEMMRLDPAKALAVNQFFSGQESAAMKAQQAKDAEAAKLSLYKAQLVRSAPKGRKLALWQQIAPDHYSKLTADGSVPSDDQIDTFIDQGLPDLYVRAGIPLPQQETEDNQVHSTVIGDDGKLYIVPKKGTKPIRTDVGVTKFAPRFFQNETGAYTVDPRTNATTQLQSGADITRAAAEKAQAVTLGKGAAERQIDAPVNVRKADMLIKGVDSVIGEIDKALKQTSGISAGLASSTKGIPATPAKNLSATLQTVKANLGFDRLQAMRDASPTGGALGQVAVQELEALQATIASLDQAQSPAQLAENLQKVKRHYTNWKGVIEQYKTQQQGYAGGQALPSNPQQVQGGIVTVNSPEEAMRLPSGTQFRTPDGRIKVRP